jgi:uncharacterized protein YyaL (SSP411 family)
MRYSRFLFFYGILVAGQIFSYTIDSLLNTHSTITTGLTRRRLSMSFNLITDYSWSFSPVPETFRFSPHSHMAHRIQWRAWGKASFDEAIHADKPIFLLLTSLWCQGCHLMDQTTLSESRVIDVINADYIPIRVDCDLRPDINQRYNQNGWPSVLLLSTEGEILWGSVYMPPTKLLYYLGYMRRYYAEHHHDIASQVHSLQDERRIRTLTQTFQAVEPATLQNVPAATRHVLRELYDPENGGFTIHPSLKFSHPDALEFLLSSRQPADYERVCYSLTQMRDGGLWDQEEGGFFRYSAANDWSAPHTEKMLDENAAMLRLLVLTARATGDEQWGQLARQLIAYVNTTLWRSDIGAFSGSQCADEDYYEPGLYSRASRTRPLVDCTIYTSWNAHMISSYLLAAQVLGDASLREQALRVLDYLCEHVLSCAGSVFHYEMGGSAFLPGQLTDQVWMIRALLDAYEACGERRYLEIASAIMQFTCHELLDTQNHLFYDYPDSPQEIGLLAVREQPLTENALLAMCAFRIAEYNQLPHFHEMASLLLSACLKKYDQTGIHGIFYAHAVVLANEHKWLGV